MKFSFRGLGYGELQSQAQWWDEANGAKKLSDPLWLHHSVHVVCLNLALCQQLPCASFIDSSQVVSVLCVCSICVTANIGKYSCVFIDFSLTQKRSRVPLWLGLDFQNRDLNLEHNILSQVNQLLQVDHIVQKIVESLTHVYKVSPQAVSVRLIPNVWSLCQHQLGVPLFFFKLCHLNKRT